MHMCEGQLANSNRMHLIAKLGKLLLAPCMAATAIMIMADYYLLQLVLVLVLSTSTITRSYLWLWVLLLLLLYSYCQFSNSNSNMHR